MAKDLVGLILSHIHNEKGELLLDPANHRVIADVPNEISDNGKAKEAFSQKVNLTIILGICSKSKLRCFSLRAVANNAFKDYSKHIPS